MSLFFDHLSSFSRLFNQISLNLNDVHYSLDLTNFEEVLLENLAKIYSSNTFSFHSNFLVPFHSKFWKGIFLLKYQRNWNLFIFSKEIAKKEDFDSDIFSSQLTESEFNSVEIKSNQYKNEMKKLVSLCQEIPKNNELNKKISAEWSFDLDLEDFIDENKYQFTRYREFLIKICFTKSLVALISPEIFETIVKSHADESIFSDFVNLLFQKALILNVPSLLPSYILKHEIFGKYLNIETLGLLYFYMTDRKQSFQDDKKKNGDPGFEKVKEICEWKMLTFNEINLKDNLNLCSLSCKSNIQKYLMSYWQNFKLKSPMEFYHNKYFEMKDKSMLKKIEESDFYAYDERVLSSFYEKTQFAFKRFELDTLDDYYGELIMKIIQNLPTLRKVNLSGLNLGDNFCLMYSDFLIVRKIYNVFSNLHIDLSNNKRITNVGLKYLYVSFDLAYCGQPVNPKHKPKSFQSSPFMSSVGGLRVSDNASSYGPTIELDVDSKASSSKTYILDNGLGSYIILKIKEHFSAKKKYCFTCEKEVCNTCHKEWTTHEGVDNIVCKRPKPKEILSESSLLLECFRKEEEIKIKERKSWKYTVRMLLYYSLIFPFILDNFIKILMIFVRLLLITMKKCNAAIQKWLDQRLVRKQKSPETKKRENIKTPKAKKSWRHSVANFVMGYDEDPKAKEVKKFKFNYNVNKLNDYLGTKSIMAFYYANLILMYAVCVIPPIWFKYYCNIFFGVYALVAFGIETAFILKIIKIVNGPNEETKKQKNLLHNFSLKYYFPLLLGSILQKYDFFTDIQFVILLFKENQYDLAWASLSIIIIMFCFSSFQLIYFSYGSVITAKENERIGIANEYINRFSTLSYLTNIGAVGLCLDLLSTKNATKFKSNYIPQIMVSAVSKCLLTNLPQFIIQIYYLTNSDVSPLILYALISTIISFIGSINTALMAKGSILTKQNLTEKFSLQIIAKKQEHTITEKTDRTEPRSGDIPLESKIIKFEEKYTMSLHNDTISPFKQTSKDDETLRQLISKNVSGISEKFKEKSENNF